MSNSIENSGRIIRVSSPAITRQDPNVQGTPETIETSGPEISTAQTVSKTERSISTHCALALEVSDGSKLIPGQLISIDSENLLPGFEKRPINFDDISADEVVLFT